MRPKFNFVELRQVVLRDFSLYKRKGRITDVSEDISPGVYCLAGANGLGKTTFLNSINYGLTGVVLDPKKDVLSPKEIVVENKKYTEKYFLGRLSKLDGAKPEIEITFSLNKKVYRIVRNFFRRDELSLLEVIDDKNRRAIFDSKSLSPKKISAEYEKLVAVDTGFGEFNYFLFYQLYVLTFDENRKMIFWDERASQHALSIAFNSEPQDADKILDYGRRIERHDSRARNLKWKSTQAKKKIEELLPRTKRKRIADVEKLEAELEKLHGELDEAEKMYNDTKIEFDKILQSQSKVNSELMLLKAEHSKLFSRYSKPRSSLLENSTILLSLKKQECHLCGSAGEIVAQNIRRSISSEKCPLCNTSINGNGTKDNRSLLKQIQRNDGKIADYNMNLNELIHELKEKQEELDKAEVDVFRIKARIENFTDLNPDISFKGSGDKVVDALIDQYRKEAHLADEDAKEQYSKRDKLKPQYEKLLKKVETSYKEAETDFVPIFKRLAKSFIGHELEIDPKRTDKFIKLVVGLHGTARTQPHQLSESQRFFLDIALRMSLAIFLSKQDNEASMLIDTPEGSLDIAYERRVGNMFAAFVMDYKQNIIMTANINASQLLIALAERCGKKNMRFRRMLDWTDLTEIQKEGEGLFKGVYSSISKALIKKH